MLRLWGIRHVRYWIRSRILLKQALDYYIHGQGPHPPAWVQAYLNRIWRGEA